MTSSPADAAVTFLPSENARLNLLLDMDLPVLVRFGRTRMTIGELLQLNTGSTIGLDRGGEDLVDILVNDRVVARGEAVVVHGNYGIRISEIVSCGAPAEERTI